MVGHLGGDGGRGRPRRASNVGSANLDARSVALDEEVNLLAFDRAITATLDDHFDADLERSIKIRPGRWKDRPMSQQLAERLTTPVRRFL